MILAMFARSKGDKSYLLRSDWLLASLVELLDSLLIVSQILLTSNKNGWKTAAEVQHLRDPLIKHVSASPLIVEMPYGCSITNLLLNVIEGVWGVDSEADKNDM